jgi:hypothetical protein
MQINTSAALITALLSAVIGFGIAFFIERKINSQAHTKPQRVLVYIAMTSVGFGLTAIFNELIGFPLQGLSIRYDKLVSYLFANIFVLPIILIVVAKMIGKKDKSVVVEKVNQSTNVASPYLKYFLMMIGGAVITIFGYSVLETNSSSDTYDMFTREDSKNCNSPFKAKPIIFTFSYKKDSNEIFKTVDWNEDGISKKSFMKLENCSILDSKNWTCGGKIETSFINAKYTFIEGVFSYEGLKLFNDPPSCPPKIVKR